MDALTNLAEEIFCSALQLDPEERRACLDRACGGDAALRSRVEGMLARGEDMPTIFNPRYEILSRQENE